MEYPSCRSRSPSQSPPRSASRNLRSMDPSGGAGDIASAKHTRAMPSSNNTDSAGDADADRLSALPDDIVAKILSCIDNSPDAVRTCVLSRRWRPVWKLLPELRFPFLPEPADRFREALVDHQVPLRLLQVQVDGHGQGALLKSVATWLPAAARRVTGSFALLNNAAPPMDEDERGEEEEAIELPCFEKATSISICLPLRLAMPPPADAAVAGVGGGVLSRLTDLCLEYVRFDHPSELGDVVSSARCPCLRTLNLRNTPGLVLLAIDSTSLLKMNLEEVIDLQELTVDAPELKELTVVHCFLFSQTPSESSSVSIAAPELVLLDWKDNMESQRHIHAQLSQFPRLRSLGSLLLIVYGTDVVFGEHNRDCLEVLQGIQFIENLTLTLGYVEDIENYQYLMEDMRTLPKFTTLHLIVISIGHSYGASLFHILRVCSGIRKLVLELHAYPEDPLTCPPGCNCEHQSNWRSEKLLLGSLEEIEIQRFGRTTRDIDFVEQLFGWATQLTKATIIFDKIVREGVAKEVCRIFEFFSRPEIHIAFRYHSNKKVLYAPED